MERVEVTTGSSDAQPALVDAPPQPGATSEQLLPFAEPVPVTSPPMEVPPPRIQHDHVGPRVVFLVAPTSSRRLAESLVLFISAILFLRSMAVEPFGVPTGSMAPTLTGNHKIAQCPRCGYLNRIGEPGKQHAAYPKATCVNCGKSDIDISDTMEIAGDRLLVDKNIFSLRSPRRWEPAVFRCPSDMTKPYVKRVIALPGERVHLHEGDVYIDDKLSRKTLVEAFEMRVPVCDMNFPPKPHGWKQRWTIESRLPAERDLSGTDPALALAGNEIRLDGSWSIQAPVWASYKHHRFDEAAGEEREEVIRDGFVYNGATWENGLSPVHDFLVDFEVEVLAGSGTLHLRAWDGGDRMVASIPVGDSDAETQLRKEGFGIVRSVPLKSLQLKTKHRIRMAFVDRRMSIAIDGSQPFQAYDLDPLPGRLDVTSPLALGVQGVDVAIRDLKIFRDIYYRSSGRNAVEEPLQLGPDEYFMLGDNSANSDDSRSWPIPGVPERNFLGKPFLLHQPSRITRIKIGNWVRYFQAIDWSRIRVMR